MIKTHKNGKTIVTRTDMEAFLNERIEEQGRKDYHNIEMNIKMSRTTHRNYRIKTHKRENKHYYNKDERENRHEYQHRQESMVY